MAIDPDNQRIALEDQNGIHVFQIETGALIASIPVPLVADIHWMDHDRLLVATRTGTWAALALEPDDLIASAAEGLKRAMTSD